MDYRETYLQWLKALKGTEHEAELMALLDNEKDLQDSFYKYLEFGTAGMRGVIGLGTNRMNLFTVKRSTQGLANYINEIGAADKGVAIAYDSRLHGDEFALASALVLAQNGVKVYLYDCLHSVPQLSYAVLKLGCIAGIVITASHNPAIYNGYKVYGADGGQLAVEDAATVTNYINGIEDLFSVVEMDKQEAIDKGLLTYISHDLDEEYYNDVVSVCINREVIDAQKDTLTVVYTPLHGSGNIPVQNVLAKLGIQNLHIVKEQQMPDPTFHTVKAPNPEEPDAFVLATKLANEVGANMILGTDPDCDRLGVCVRKADGEFMVLTGNQIGVLLLDYILSQKQASFTGDEFVVKSIVSTNMAEVIARYYGVELRNVLTGFKFIAEQIKLSEQTGKGKFLFGFEESFGFLSGTFVRDKDACIAATMVTEMTCYYASQGKTLYDALNDLYAKYGYFKEKVLSMTLAGMEGIAKIQNAVKTMRESKPTEIGGYKISIIRDYLLQTSTDLQSYQVTPIELPKSDVLYYELEGGASFVIRPSGTEPKLKAYLTVSAADNDTAEKALDALVETVQNLMADLTK